MAADLGRLAPGFAAQFRVLPLLAALLLALGWFYLVFFTAPAPIRSVLRWAAGVVLLWGTVAMLWMPWADYQKSYRSVALRLPAAIPPNAGSFAAQCLGVPPTAALPYQSGTPT